MLPTEIRCKQLVELITDYLEGALSPDLRRAFEQHLAECAGCREYLAHMRHTIRLLGTAKTAALDAYERNRLLELFRAWNR